jgi:hypothetical protein
LCFEVSKQSITHSKIQNTTVDSLILKARCQMLRKIRIFLQMATLVLVLGSILLIAPHSVYAAAAPFLTNPFYEGTYTFWTYFDHQIPYNTAGIGTDLSGVVTYQGGAAQNVNYSGHAGYDYAMDWKPVLAAATGTVTESKWNYTDHSLGCGLYIKLTHTQVTPNHQTLYCHLSAMLVQTGAAVTQKQQIGTSGDSGESDPAHLHFEVRVLDSSVSPARWLPTDPNGFATGTDPWKTVSGVTSVNLWLTNRTVAAPANNGEFIIDDSATNTASFKRWCAADANGSQSLCPYWNSSASAGYNSGHLFYTYANGTTVDYQAKWVPGTHIATTGNYEVQVYLPANYATSGAVRYTVYYNGGSRLIIVDQWYTSSKWVSLGTYPFAAGGSGYVRIEDAAYFAGFTDSMSNMIGVDAVKFIKRP